MLAAAELLDAQAPILGYCSDISVYSSAILN